MEEDNKDNTRNRPHNALLTLNFLNNNKKGTRASETLNNRRKLIN